VWGRYIHGRAILQPPHPNPIYRIKSRTYTAYIYRIYIRVRTAYRQRAASGLAPLTKSARIATLPRTPRMTYHNPHSPPLQRKLIDKIYTKKINPRGKGVGGSVFFGGSPRGGRGEPSHLRLF
jgi:hypothetical protein